MQVISNNLQNVYGENAIGKEWEYKLAYSICLELAEKFQKKVKTQLKKANLFDTTKQVKISLKYYEAWALYQYLQNWVLNQSNYRDELRVQNVINTLNQKLL